MGAQSAQWAAAARLVRRTGFGATGVAVDAALKLGAAGYVATILTADPNTDPGAKATPAPTFAPIARVGKSATADARHQRNQQVGAQLTELTGWWLRRMSTVAQPSTEKLTFCWHNHFATAATKVREAGWLLQQNQRLRTMATGQFRPLALTMLTDAAMLEWLDGEKNTEAAPNENLSREFMELFALGHGDGYTETDVREGARALTGWKIRSDGSTFLSKRLHDSGSKTFLGVTGDLDVTGYCDAILARPASPGYIASRWWGQLVSDVAPSAATLTALIAAYGPARSMSALFTAMLTRPEFAGAEGTLMIDPVEWLIGAVRALKAPVQTDAAVKKLMVVLRELGQVPFYPPSVAGWPAAQAWLSTAAADARMQAGLVLASAGDISLVADTAVTERLDALGYLLGVAEWSVRTTAVLKTEIANPPRLVAVALNSSEYLVH